jgi:hypothetical protein
MQQGLVLVAFAGNIAGAAILLRCCWKDSVMLLLSFRPLQHEI